MEDLHVMTKISKEGWTHDFRLLYKGLQKGLKIALHKAVIEFEAGLFEAFHKGVDRVLVA